MGMIKYRIHEVAKDFNVTSKVISQILTDYIAPPKNHMQVLENHELDVIFEYMTQHNQADSLEEIFKAGTPKPVEKPAEDKVDKYSAMDPRVRTGAYRIVGTAQTVKVKEGDNLLKISRRYLGPDMECYLEVYNNLKASSVLKTGQEIKIPKLELKKKKKAQSVKQ